MSNERTKRLERLVELRARAVSEMEARVAAARRRTTDARVAHGEALRAWEQAASRDAGGPMQIGDMLDQGQRLIGLRRRADAIAKAMDERVREEAACLRDLLAARQDHRKLEVWRDGILDGARRETERRERIATDEIGARRARAS